MKMASQKFDECVAKEIRGVDMPTYSYIYKLYCIASRIIRELSNTESPFILALFEEMMLPPPEIYSRTMEIYGSMIC